MSISFQYNIIQAPPAGISPTNMSSTSNRQKYVLEVPGVGTNPGTGTYPGSNIITQHFQFQIQFSTL
jgi:hypothetical protein